MKRELRLLSAAINFVRTEHDYPELANPVQSLGLDGGESRVRWISRSEATALILAAGAAARQPHLRNFVRLALSTGCRKNELLALEWHRVDFERSHFRLECEHTKNGKRRLVPLNSGALLALRDQSDWVARHCAGSEWVFASSSGRRVGNLQKGFVAACARAGIENFRIHDLRHTFAHGSSWRAFPCTSSRTCWDIPPSRSLSAMRICPLITVARPCRNSCRSNRLVELQRHSKFANTKQNWTVVYYNERVKRDVFALPAGILADYLRLLDLMQEFGADLRMPHSRAMGADCLNCAQKAGKASGACFTAPMLDSGSWSCIRL
ncbi:tyrosine-type recombinase/integrase [Burkholderia pseudomallei]|uniref:tyrosine-type recombinase/integrase n=1 Tax=Burkholderia pseudomallei TaxID=28450 RepID=UPI001E2CCC44|nr:tyrosine-type recombinase/integrase [Burkholderia pseudomallei]